MLEKFRHRSLEPENLDKGTYTPEEYEGCLVELRRVNEWLGDANALRDSMLKEIERSDLLMLLEGIDTGSVKRMKRYRREEPKSGCHISPKSVSGPMRSAKSPAPGQSRKKGDET